MTNPRANPYPGPRSFQKDEKLYGRQRETWELLNLLIGERIVLLSSPSGAGKTSLVQAALLPELQHEGFRVLPVMRPGLLPDQPAPGANRYVLSLLLGLEAGREGAEQLPLAELGSLSLRAYLARAWPVPDGAHWHGDVLLFDQFEEVLTVDPGDRAAKQVFFEEVGAALRDRGRWALFSMREEFVAALDPYLRPIPARFDKGRRYHLDLLGPEAAREAMQGPAADQAPSVIFSDAAAHRLADDLRRVQVQQPDGQTQTTLGPFIEPVQLQVVCRRLWDNLAPDDRTIDVDDLAAVGDVDTALRGYYADTMATVAEETGLRQRTLREWVDRQLITESGIRGQVLMGAEASQGLTNTAIWPLVNAHLVRAEQRRGVTWFELAHDRLVAPVRADNGAWFAEHLSTLQRQAALWRDQGKPDGLLLGGAMLAQAEQWQAAQTVPLETWEADFLAESKKAWEQAVKERRQNRLIRILAVVAALVAIVAVAAAFFAYSQSVLARQNEKLAQDNEIKAQSNAQEAAKQARIATSQSQLATARELAAAAVSSLDKDPELSLLLAMQAITPTYTTEGEDALRQALQTDRLSQRIEIGSGALGGFAYDPGGARVAILAGDGRLELWPVVSAEVNTSTVKGTARSPLWTSSLISGTEGLAVAYSPDGTHIATTHGDGQVRIWAAATGELQATLDATDLDSPGTQTKVYSAAFSPGGRTLATGQDSGIRLWNMAALDQPAELLYGHEGAVAAVAFKPDDQQLLTGGIDGKVLVWNANGDIVQEWQAHSGSDKAIYGLDISPDGKLLATGSQDKTAVIWDITSEEPQKLRTLYDHTNSVRDVQFSPNGACLATISADRTTKLWDAATGQLLLNLPGLGDWGTGVAFNPADKPTPAAPGQAADTFDNPYRCGQTLAASGRDGVLRIWNIGPNHEGRLFVGHGGAVESAVFSPDGRHVATGSDDGTARMWDAATGRQELALPEHTARINSVAFSPPDGKVLAAASWDGTADLYDSQTRKRLITLKDPGRKPIQSLSFSPDGSLVATASGDDHGKGNVVVWETASGKPRYTWKHMGALYGAAFDSAGAQLAVTGSDGQIYIYDLNSGEQVKTLGDGTQTVYAGVFSPDGKHLATANWDGTAQVWSLPDGKLEHTLRGHTDRIYGLQFSPDGNILATSSADRTIRLWDAATGALLRTLPGPEFNSLQFSPDGQSLVVGGEDGTARIYTLSIDNLLSAAANRLTRSWTTDECKEYLHAEQCPNARGN